MISATLTELRRGEIDDVHTNLTHVGLGLGLETTGLVPITGGAMGLGTEVPAPVGSRGKVSVGDLGATTQKLKQNVKRVNF